MQRVVQKSVSNALRSGCALAVMLLFFCVYCRADGDGNDNSINNLANQYVSIKEFLTEWTVSHPDNLIYTQGSDVAFFYMDCTTASDVIGLNEISDEVTALTDLAGFVIDVTSAMKVNNYPDAIWKPLLAEFENERLARFSRNIYREQIENPESEPERKFLTMLSVKLNNYLDTQKLQGPRMMWSYFCGTGFRNDIIFKSIPPAKRIEIIPVFWYMYCAQQGTDPLDRDKCHFWRDTNDGKKESVGGEYYLRAYWNDESHSILRKYDLSTMGDGDTLTISAP